MRTPLLLLILLTPHLRITSALPGNRGANTDSSGKDAAVGPLIFPQTQTTMFNGLEVVKYLERDTPTGELLSFEPEPMMVTAAGDTGARILGREVGAVTKQVVCQWSPDAPLVVDVKTMADYLANSANVNIMLVQSSPGLKPASVDDCYSLSNKDYYRLFTLATPATTSNPHTPLLSLSICGKPGNYIPTSTAAHHLHNLIRDCTLDERVAGRVYVRPDEAGGREEIAVAVWTPFVDDVTPKTVVTKGAVETDTEERQEDEGRPMKAQKFPVEGTRRSGLRQDVMFGGVVSGPYTRYW